MKRSSKCLKGFFYIEGKLKLQCLTILWKSRWVGGVFELGNPEGRGTQAVLEIQVRVWVKKPCLPSWGCGFFCGIPHCYKILVIHHLFFYCYDNFISARRKEIVLQMKETLLHILQRFVFYYRVNYYPEKTADILICYHWLPCGMMSENIKHRNSTVIDLFHNGGLLIHSFLCMIIGLSNLISM